jgi:hypothetical protein
VDLTLGLKRENTLTDDCAGPPKSLEAIFFQSPRPIRSRRPEVAVGEPSDMSWHAAAARDRLAEKKLARYPRTPRFRPMRSVLLR